MEPMTREESNILQKFRTQVADLGLTGIRNSDIFLLRWIRARDHKLKDAETMLRKHLEWRKVNKIDDILNWQGTEYTSTHLPYEITGFSKIGCPVFFVPFGRWDIKKGIDEGESANIIRYVDHGIETCEALMEKRSTQDKPVTQLIFIFDMAHLHFMQFASVKAVETIVEVARRFEANHPETLYTAYVLNTSRVFAMLFKIIKPFLSTKTLGKVEIYQSNPIEWTPILLKNIPGDQLPPAFGGTGSSSLKYYQDNLDHTVKVGAGSFVHLDYDIQTVPAVFSWKFKTDHYDIGFRIFRIKDDKEISVIPYDRVQSQIYAIKGEMICENSGKYKIEFDNSYSRMRAKIVHYNVSINPATCNNN